ncbi:MAG: hypothetical protein A2268_09800 [Candidatus Raymondbacteria bacterium RifOxyA12_full_50_37]|uniref:Uncharacterized protein n=1 Tax=Candidatus Raymondbacteria bacterium RIFOXYD12_FULL_49_13 TaxID=1817890 RepID=A0A1F7F1W8_UNCRA|nr:MAG: hypothetical protein A2268_09800 [Candidatus Raymondbacteria bacterium RifOxyA12_full_50_37]OGJ93868.1 MAG: hypothetical protein A2248_06495 [Candidatus Raymondbacteria bacterium RIFOXYA2_FULL_49_16]OGJ98263.1 MAG: hypothetical protein A2453_00670 [Candidatus Raymondbacteria bacterium RIFOXYC2_FULL_50_21]OGJ98427.1 MAG: hypothetical protein A2350_14300 [Candidatus Raymondbacteria bacterium RifOxyB12_full_50_8]OGK00496.1 MAG: hypothetical protein A2519_10845 [Candidatus Raymondbacteria b
MKFISVISIIVVLASTSFGTEARIESMGNTPDFIKDEVSAIKNPATTFGFGNTLLGSLGKETKLGDSWVRKEQWFGGWAIYPISPTMKLSVGATLNKPFETTQQYEAVSESGFFTVFDKWNYSPTSTRVNFLDVLGMGTPYGNVYMFAGVSIKDMISLALGGRYAGYKQESNDENKYISIQGGNLGLVYNILNQHQFEASINVDRFVFEGKDESTSPEISVSSSDLNFDINARLFWTMSRMNSVVPMFSFKTTNILGISTSDVGGGIGFNRTLYKGLIWVGGKYLYYSAEFPERIGGEAIYSPSTNQSLVENTKESSHKIIASFGVEKKMLWDWFTIRVGGNKVFEYLTKTDKSDRILEKGLFERDVDAVAWGVALGTKDDALRFDITVSEEFPYSNIFAGGDEGIMLVRISAALKF